MADFCGRCGAQLMTGMRFCPKCGNAAENKTRFSFCSSCGAQLVAGMRFCPKCGASAEKKPPATFCRHCGKQLESRSKFCPRCGTPVNKPQQIIQNFSDHNTNSQKQDEIIKQRQIRRSKPVQQAVQSVAGQTVYPVRQAAQSTFIQASQPMQQTMGSIGNIANSFSALSAPGEFVLNMPEMSAISAAPVRSGGLPGFVIPLITGILAGIVSFPILNLFSAPWSFLIGLLISGLSIGVSIVIKLLKGGSGK